MRITHNLYHVLLKDILIVNVHRRNALAIIEKLFLNRINNEKFFLNDYS